MPDGGTKPKRVSFKSTTSHHHRRAAADLDPHDADLHAPMRSSMHEMGSINGAPGTTAVATYNPYDEATERFYEMGHHPGTTQVSGGHFVRPSPCRFCIPPTVVFAILGLLASLTAGAIAAARGAHPDFTCRFTHDAPPTTIALSAVSIVLLAAGLIISRRVWRVAAPPATSGDHSTRRARREVFCCRAVLIIMSLLLLLAAFAGGTVSTMVILLASQHPELDGTVTIGAAAHGGFPRAPVSIARDENGLAHIEGASVEDVIFAQGFAHGQDRLWQIEFERLVARGELARHVGSAGLKIDRQTRRLGLHRAAKAMCQAASPRVRAQLAAYVAGLNAYLRTSSKRPAEFFFMGTSWWPLTPHEPEPFVVDDVCYPAKLLQMRLGGNMRQEVERFRMWWAAQGRESGSDAAATYEEITALYTNQTNITGTILSAEDLNITAADVASRRAEDADNFQREAELYRTSFVSLRNQLLNGGAATASAANAAADDSQTEDEEATAPWLHKAWAHAMGATTPKKLDLLEMVEDHASNAWAARAAGNASARACGASDPHLEITLPSVWYYAHLAVRDPATGLITFETSGVGLPGIPGVHIGKNRNVSWGITMAITDIQDLFVAVPDAQRPDTHYVLANGTSVPYVLRTETIEHKHGLFAHVASETMVVKETIYGPDVAPINDMPPGVVAALWSPILQADSTSVEAISYTFDPSMATADDLCRGLFQRLRSPAFSAPSADVHGNLAYCISGAYRVRARGHTGMWPTLGDGRFDPSATEIPVSELPGKRVSAAAIESSVPGSSSISCANQKIYPDGYRYALGFDFIPPFRGRRLQQLLRDPANAARLSDVTFHQRVQLDTQSNLWAQSVRPLFAARDPALLRTCLSDAGAALHSRLMQWDGVARLGATEPTALWMWVRGMSTAVRPITSAAGADFWGSLTFVPQLLADADTRPANITAFFTRVCASALGRMPAGSAYCQPGASGLPACWELAAAQLNVVAGDGAGMARPWGREVAQLAANNLMMAKSPLACMFDRVVDKDGDPTSVDVNGFRLDAADLRADHASSMRQLYDWGAPGAVRFAWPGGASGYPYSDRYANLLPTFSADGYVGVQVEGGLPPAALRTHHQTVLP